MASRASSFRASAANMTSPRRVPRPGRQNICSRARWPRTTCTPRATAAATFRRAASALTCRCTAAASSVGCRAVRGPHPQARGHRCFRLP
eukprot:528357-Pyramimonas_sp.AAC.1